jgi:hypothetical protein
VAILTDNFNGLSVLPKTEDKKVYSGQSRVLWNRRDWKSLGWLGGYGVLQPAEALVSDAQTTCQCCWMYLFAPHPHKALFNQSKSTPTITDTDRWSEIACSEIAGVIEYIYIFATLRAL